jgi:hypothetical protein
MYEKCYHSYRFFGCTKLVIHNKWWIMSLVIELGSRSRHSISLKVLSFQPCVPIVIHRRTCESVADIGMNELVEWRPDSSMLVVAVSSIIFSVDEIAMA